jgi:hypothetical protein
MTGNIEDIVIEHLKSLRGVLKEFRYKYDADMFVSFSEYFHILDSNPPCLTCHYNQISMPSA